MIHSCRLPTLFPYTTLFRSRQVPRTPDVRQLRVGHGLGDDLLRQRGPPAAMQHRRVQLAQLGGPLRFGGRSEEHTSELQSRENLVCRLLLEKKNSSKIQYHH